MSGMCRMTEGVLWSTGDGTLANHLDQIERAGVDCAVTCPIATKPGHWRIIFDRARRILRGECGDRARARIVPFASVHPDDPELEAHLRVIAEGGIRGVKFHPYYQDFALTEARSRRMFDIVADLGLVVQCHAGGDICWRESTGRCGPREIESLVKRCRRLKFIAAHLGGCFRQPAHEADRLMDCGVYTDTSVLHARWHYDEEMRLLRSWPRELIMFGTDFPWTHYPEAIRWVKSVREQRDWEDLFGGNACRLLGL